MNKMKENNKGFTLVELVIVIAIIAILAALLVPNIIGSVEDAQVSKEMADARSLASEITTSNAMEATDASPDYIVSAETEAGKSFTLHSGETRDVPNFKYVQIIVDTNNAAVVQWTKAGADYKGGTTSEGDPISKGDTVVIDLENESGTTSEGDQ